MIPLNLDGIGGDPNEEDTPFVPPNIYIETAMLALESEKGVAVETTSRKHAMALRHRFYREIGKEKAKGNTSLSSVTISLHKTEIGWELHLTNLPFKVRPL